EGGADGLLEGGGAGLERDDLGAEELHPLDVRSLAADVLAAHVDGALKAEKGTGGRCCDTVLARPRLGDHPALPHAPREQRLADRVVDLVRTGVSEVLALQIDAAANSLGEALGRVERRRPPDEVAQQGGQLGLEAIVLPGLGPGGAELVERRNQRLGDEAAAVGAEALLDRGAHCEGTWVGCSTPAASRKASTLAWSLRPGSASTPLTTSTPKGLTRPIASPTFPGVRPPARIIGTFERRLATSSQSKLLPVPPWVPCPEAAKRGNSGRRGPPA